jgi:peptidyl-prolyl cis-trans isomerase D
MALIGKIRNNFWLVLILLAMALASFIIMDVMGSRRGGGMFDNNGTTIGEVAGQKIDYRDFEKVERTLYSGNTGDVYNKRATIWTYLTEKAVIENQAEAMGLGVSKEELMDLQFGANMSPIMRNNWSNPQTGQVDMQQLLQYKQAFESGQDLNPDFRAFWAEQEKQIISNALQTKINDLVSKATITPKWQADVMSNLNGDIAEVEYVRVTFDKLPEAEAKVTDEDYTTFLGKYPGRYKIDEETRTVQYASFAVAPTQADTQAIRAKLNDLKTQFATATNDSLFSVSNGGALVPAYQKSSDITGSLKEALGSLAIGQVFGPYEQQGSLLLSKLIDKRTVPDSVKARHILRSGTVGIESARKYIDSLKNLIVSGRARFDSLAIKNSEDPGSGAQGGDLGTFAQGTMVQAFNDVCFITGKPGGLYVVETQFGVHLIEVQNQKYVDNSAKYKFATIPQVIVPSAETQNKVYDRVTKLMSNIKSPADIEALSKTNPDINVNVASSLTKNDFQIQGFTGSETSRNIVKWAYSNDKGDVSKTVYSYSDATTQAINNYVIVGLKEVNKAGNISVTQAKELIAQQVINWKKGEVLKTKIKGTDLNAIANQFGTTVDSDSITFGSANFTSITSTEPVVAAKLFGLEKGGVSAPITGSSGVFVGRLKNKIPATLDQTGQLKQSITMNARQSIAYRIWDAMKKKFQPVDNRSNFF